jgi:thiosulfate dehydrogenase [quinone] large subunit
LILLRVFVGWQFLYEGIIKWIDPAWSAASFLKSSTWIFAGLFSWIAGNNIPLAAADILNEAGLVLIGAALIAGLLTRPAAVAGIALLGLYYLAHPPFLEGGAGEHYLLIDKNLVEMAVLFLLLAFDAGRIAGIDALIKNRRWW